MSMIKKNYSRKFEKLTVVTPSQSCAMYRFSFRIAKTRDFWSLLRIFEGLHDIAAFDKLSRSLIEHNCNMVNG